MAKIDHHLLHFIRKTPPLSANCKKMLLPLKLMTSLVSGDFRITNNTLFLTQNPQNCNHHHLDENEIQKGKRTPLMLFIPTQELVRDTYRLSQIARAIGMDINPNSSLSHLIFSWPSLSSPQQALALGNDAVPIPFPSFKTAALTHLRLFVNLSRGYFRLAFLNGSGFDDPLGKIESLSNNNWHCSSLALFFRRTGEKIVSMEGFSQALLGMGWALFKTNLCEGKSRKQPAVVYLYRKLGVNKICNSGSGQCSRVKELKLPLLDFGNVPLRILQYILLMTDDIFYLA